jgi:HK97 family phage major capsid protein
MQDTELADLIASLETLGQEYKSAISGEAGLRVKALAGLDARLVEIEQKLARRAGGDGRPETKTWGQLVVEADSYKAFASSPSQRGSARIETKAIVNMTSTVGVGGAMITPDYRPDPVMLAMRRPTVRSLLAPGRTESNTVFYPQQTARDNSAATVAEGALKPQSDILFTQKQAAVSTIATIIVASRQLLDDAPAMQATIDNELRYMLSYTEETQLLFGDGTGVNLLGLVPQATAYSAPFVITSGETLYDRLLLAIGQAEASLYPATGMILNTVDYIKLLATKDGLGNYIAGSPWSAVPNRVLWDLPIVPTMAMPVGFFMVGAFAIAAQIYDRLETEVLISSEHLDFFARNLLAIRGEERLAMAVKIPAALIYGSVP